MTAEPAITPWDEHNQTLSRRVRPSNWPPPQPDGPYHLVVIGAGTAGLVTAAGAAGLGARVALIERQSMGGDCLNSGCVPSKALIAAARAVAAAREAARLGVGPEVRTAVDFPAVMERLRRLRAEISVNDSAERFRKLGVDVYFGAARFVDGSTIDVDGTRIPFRKAVIATGARAAAPPISGLERVRFLTNETLFSLTEQPRRLAIIGAGPVGCEMAQTFARLGTEVLLIDVASGILPRDDRDAAEVVSRALAREGVAIHSGATKLRVESDSTGPRIEWTSHGRALSETFDQLLIAAGRTPNVEHLGLDHVGVAVGEQGIVVNDRLQTSNPRIYAAGDVCSSWRFTHAADFMARIVIQNALFLGRRRFSSLVIPWCTYTSPEVAHVGLLPDAAEAQGIPVETFTQPFSEVDRALLEGHTEGFVRVHVRRGTDRILGATIVAEHAGDMIGELSLAMTQRIGLGKIAATIHPYPTQAEAIRKLGDQYNRTRLTPRVQSLFRTWLRWTR